MRGNRQAARQGAEVNDEIAARQIPEAPGRVAQDDVEVPVLTTRDLRQNVEVAGETQASGVETTGRAEGGIDEATPVPSSTLPSPDQEESVVAEEPPLGRKASPAAGAMELSPPPEVSDVNLPSPSPVPPLPDEPTAQTVR